VPVRSVAVLSLIVSVSSHAGSQGTLIREEKWMIRTYPYSDQDPIPILSRDPHHYPYFSFDSFTDDGRDQEGFPDGTTTTPKVSRGCLAPSATTASTLMMWPLTASGSESISVTDLPRTIGWLRLPESPFGLMGEMLEKGGNPWRGMAYGMTSRLPWAGDPRPGWKLWDRLGIHDSRMIGGTGRLWGWSAGRHESLPP
jgi:hypothetical protein